MNQSLPNQNLITTLLPILLLGLFTTMNAQDYQQVTIQKDSMYSYQFECYPWPDQPAGASNGTVNLEYLGLNVGIWLNSLNYQPNIGFIGLDSIQQCYNERDSNEYICAYFEIEVVDSPLTSSTTELVNKIKVSVSKNPFIEESKLRLELMEAGVYSVDIIDLSGRLIKTICKKRLMSGIHEEWIRKEDTVKGLNIIRVQNEKGESIALKVLRI